MEDRIKKLEEQLQSIRLRKDELSGELNKLNILGLKIEGALEILEDLTKEKEQNNLSKKKEEKKSD